MRRLLWIALFLCTATALAQKTEMPGDLEVGGTIKSTGVLVCLQNGTNCSAVPIPGAGGGWLLLGGTGATSMSTTITQYFTVVGNNALTTTEADVYYVVPALSPAKLSCRVTGGNLTVGSFAFAVRNAGSATNLDWSCSIGVGAAQCVDTVGSAIADGTLIDIQVVPSGTPDANRRGKCYFVGS